MVEKKSNALWPQIIRSFCLVAFTAAAVSLLLEARLVLKDSRISIQTTFSGINTAMTNFNDAAIATKERSDAELREVQKTTVDLKHLIGATDLNLNGRPGHPGMLPRLNYSVNDVLVPQVATNLKDLDKLELQVAQKFVQTMDELQPTLKNLADGSASFAQIAGDEHIRELIINAAVMSGDAEKAVKDLEGVTANLDTASQLLLQRLRDALKPVPFIRAIAEKLLGVTSQAVQIYYGTHK